MGVLGLQNLVCGQIILLLLVMIDITDADQTSKSSLKTASAPPLNATGNYTENHASNTSSSSTYNESPTTQNNLTTQVTPTASMNSTSGLNQTNATVTASTQQPNATETIQTTQSSASSKSTGSTAATSPGISTKNSTTSRPVTKTTQITSTVTQNGTIPQGGGLNHSEKSITVLFSILLGVIVVVVLGHFVYKYGRNKERSVQYTHRRLQNEDTGEPFAVPDDTLVISGGLYDGPQIYNPTMTVQNEEEFQTDALGFSSRPPQFRLEFLREDEERGFDPDMSTYQTFRPHDQED